MVLPRLIVAEVERDFLSLGKRQRFRARRHGFCDVVDQLRGGSISGEGARVGGAPFASRPMARGALRGKDSRPGSVGNRLVARGSNACLPGFGGRQGGDQSQKNDARRPEQSFSEFYPHH